jgi:hypothetical protein
MTWFPAPPVRRFIRRFAATFARGLALVHRQIAGERTRSLETKRAGGTPARCQNAEALGWGNFSAQEKITGINFHRWIGMELAERQDKGAAV